jgi:preprotein translocase subunit SecE
LEAESYFYSEVYDIMSKLIGFFKDVVSEMRKVSWPRRKELTRYTIVVLSTVVFMAVYFGIIDIGISRVMEWYVAL